MTSKEQVDEKLDSLQTLLINKLIDKIASGEATSAELNVARQLLKDNNFEALPEAKPSLLKLAGDLPFDVAQAS